MLPSLVDPTLNTTDDTVLPSANWVLDLLDGIKDTMADITMFQDQLSHSLLI